MTTENKQPKQDNFESYLFKMVIIALFLGIGYIMGVIVSHEKMAQLSQQYVYDVVTEHCIISENLPGEYVMLSDNYTINLTEKGWLEDDKKT